MLKNRVTNQAKTREYVTSMLPGKMGLAYRVVMSLDWEQVPDYNLIKLFLAEETRESEKSALTSQPHILNKRLARNILFDSNDVFKGNDNENQNDGDDQNENGRRANNKQSIFRK